MKDEASDLIDFPLVHGIFDKICFDFTWLPNYLYLVSIYTYVSEQGKDQVSSAEKEKSRVLLTKQLRQRFRFRQINFFFFGNLSSTETPHVVYYWLFYHDKNN